MSAKTTRVKQPRDPKAAACGNTVGSGGLPWAFICANKVRPTENEYFSHLIDIKGVSNEEKCIVISLRKHRPELVLLDIGDLNDLGLSLCNLIKKELPHCHVLIWTHLKAATFYYRQLEALGVGSFCIRGNVLVVALAIAAITRDRQQFVDPKLVEAIASLEPQDLDALQQSSQILQFSKRDQRPQEK